MLSENLIELNNFNLADEKLLNELKDFARSAYAENTIVSYKKDWRNFHAWFEARKLPSTLFY